MNINVNTINRKICEVSVDEINSGLLNASEAKELAIQLLEVAAELLELKDT
jgi:hypothetical protein